MNWYINQEIVCVLKRGGSVLQFNKTYVIRGIAKSVCGCHNVLLDVGFTSDLAQSCARCRKDTFGVGVWWFDENCFAPLDTLDEQIKEALTTSIEI